LGGSLEKTTDKWCTGEERGHFQWSPQRKDKAETDMEEKGRDKVKKSGAKPNVDWWWIRRNLSAASRDAQGAFSA
jgi:hypothetical protein